jgi:REP element-mobilizing transposase RayT
MRSYKRLRIEGGCYFFTVNLAKRHGNDLLVRHIDDLREAIRMTMRDHPFTIDAMVVLPDHLHCLWQMRPGDVDFPNRWRLIKARFSRCVARGERISVSRQRKGEREFGNGVIGNMPFVTRRITSDMSITSITTQLSMDTSRRRTNGRIHLSCVGWIEECIPRIGQRRRISSNVIGNEMLGFGCASSQPTK